MRMMKMWITYDDVDVRDLQKKVMISSISK